MYLDRMTVEQLNTLLEKNLEVARSLSKMLAIVPKRSRKYQLLKDQIDIHFKKNLHIHDLLCKEMDKERDKRREARALSENSSNIFWSLQIYERIIQNFF